MAAIERIRRRSGLLIAIIGIALLAFVLQDLFQSQGRNREYNIAVIDGEKIPYQDYETQREKNLENRRSQSNNNLSSAETYSIYNSTLDEMIKQNIMTKEYEAVGMNVSSDELYDQFMGENPHQWVVQSFSNQDGTFNKEMVEYYLQNLSDFPVDAQARWMEQPREGFLYGARHPCREILPKQEHESLCRHHRFALFDHSRLNRRRYR